MSQESKNHPGKDIEPACVLSAGQEQTEVWHKPELLELDVKETEISVS